MGQAAQALRARARRVADLPRTGIVDGARLVVDLAEAEGRRAAPSGVGNRGRRRRLTARPVTTTGHASIFGEPANGWTWVTTGTRPHPITSRRGYLYGPGMRHPVRAVAHPGGRGRHAWDRVADTAARDVPALFQRLTSEAVRG